MVSAVKNTLSGRYRVSTNGGYTVMELIVTMALFAILAAIALFNYRATEDVATNASNNLMGFIKNTRSKALVTTRAYTIKAPTSTSVVTTYGSSCSDPVQTADPQMTFTFPTSAWLSDTSWSICYSTRGISSSSATINVHDSTHFKTVQVVMGGGARVL